MKDIKLKDKIAQGINDLFYIWKREFQTTFRDQGVLIFFILVPLGYPLLYSSNSRLEASWRCIFRLFIKRRFVLSTLFSNRE